MKRRKGIGLFLITVLFVFQNTGWADDGFDQVANGAVYSLAVQTNGQILVAGDFTTLGDQPRNHLGRLNADGSLDTTFTNGVDGYYSVNSLAVQADGKILVGGNFTTLGGQARRSLGRLNADGSLDTSFTSEIGGDQPWVQSLAVQADGKILVGGWFTTLGGQTRDRLGRLNADGTLDTTFPTGSMSGCYALAVQADGKILVGGAFTTLGGQARNCLGRLNADGTLDATFTNGANYFVCSLAVQADGKILVGGDFTTLGGQPRNYLGRLNADGTLDTTFTNGANSRWVGSLAVQADGKILVGGGFTTLGGQTRIRLGRLNADGTLDTTFTNGANDQVSCSGGAGGREDSGRGRFHDAGRAAAHVSGPPVSRMARWTRASPTGPITRCILWRCRRTARFWSAVNLQRWAGSRALI